MGGFLSEALIHLTEALKILSLMVEHLLNLLSCHHLLYKAINLTKFLLLPVKIFLAMFTVKLNKEKHDNKKHNNYN